MTKISAAQKDALRLLAGAGGEGVLDSRAALVAGGEKLSQIAPETLLRLVTLGMVEPRGPMRLGLTPLGIHVAEEASRFKEDPSVISGWAPGPAEIRTSDDEGTDTFGS